MADIDFSKLTRSQKLAIFLIVVGPETAASVLKNFDDAEVEIICREMSSYPMVPDAIRQQVLEEFAPIIGDSCGTPNFLNSGLLSSTPATSIKIR